MVQSIRVYQHNPQLFILEKIIDDGIIKINFEASFDQNGKIKNNYLLKGALENVNLDLLGENKINNINFDFQITKDKYFFEDINLKYKEQNLKSQRITFLKNKNDFFVE